MDVFASRPALVLACATALTTWSLGSAAVADPAAGDRGHGHPRGSSAATASAAPATEPGRTARPARAERPAPHRPLAASGPARPADHGAASRSASTERSATRPGPARPGDPGGNNGTVKIDRLGDIDRIPNNVPHPGCTFQVEWYGYDGGDDVRSTVTFAAVAPTADVDLTVAGPAVVPVGGDAASGAGTPSGADAVQAYSLAFAGPAQARQGYHVRLTVATPRSHGNDTKTKVFWVEPCTAVARTAAGAAAHPGASSGAVAAAAAGAVPDASVDAAVAAGAPALPGLTRGSGSAPAVSARSAAASSTSGSAVPLAVDAGTRGTLGRWTNPSLASGLTLAGLVLLAAGLVLRLRRRA